MKFREPVGFLVQETTGRRGLERSSWMQLGFRNKLSHLTDRCLFTIIKNGFWGFNRIIGKAVSPRPQNVRPCAETHHMTCRSLKSIKPLSRYNDFSFSSRWWPSAILDLWDTFWDHLQRVLGGLYHYVKLSWNRCSRFDNMKVWIFCTLGFKTPIHAPIWVFWAYDRLSREQYQCDPSKAHPCTETRHMT